MGQAEVEKPDSRSKKAFLKKVKKILLLKEAFSKSVLLLIKKWVYIVNNLFLLEIMTLMRYDGLEKFATKSLRECSKTEV